MARQAGPAGADLLKEAERLACEGYGKGEIADRLVSTSPTIFSSRLVWVSQQTSRPFPRFESCARRPF
jgi:hypothetical protein